MAVVYQHFKKGTKEVYYVGISSSTNNRPYNFLQRSEIWKRYYQKYGVDVVISHKGICKEEAICIEKYLINFYGRISNVGTLVNMTDGGDGTNGRIMSDKEKNKISERMRISSIGNKNNTGKKRSESSKLKSKNSHIGKKQTEETKIKMSNAHKGHKRNIGLKRTQEQKEKISNSIKGIKRSLETVEKIRATSILREQKKKDIKLKLGLLPSLINL